MASDDTRSAYQQRFEFLFPPGVKSPRFRLEPPDMLQANWSIWDRISKYTVCVAGSALEAVDRGLARFPEVQS